MEHIEVEKQYIDKYI